MNNGTRKDDDYKRGSLIGKNNTGKTTMLLEEIVYPSYDLNHHRVIFLSDSNPKALAKVPRIHTYDQLRKLECGMVKFFDHSVKPAVMLENIINICREGQRNREKGLPASHWYLHNGAIILDDCSNWLRGNVPESITTFLGNHRHYFLDLFFTVHSLKDLPSLLRRRMHFFTVFKTLDSFESDKRLEQLDYPNAENLYKAWVEVMNDPDNYAHNSIITA